MREFVEVPSEPDDGVAALAQQAWQMEIAGKLSLVVVLAIAVKVLWAAFHKEVLEARKELVKALTDLRQDFVRMSTLLAVVVERQQSTEGRMGQFETTVGGLKERVVVLEHAAAASNSGVRKRVGNG